MLCAIAIHVPVAIPAPCAAANIPPATGPATPNPMVLSISGEPNITPVTQIGVKTTAVTSPIFCYIIIYYFFI